MNTTNRILSDKSLTEIKQEWILFSKELKKDEFQSLIVSEDQYEWFGRTMSYIKEESVNKKPCGTECRNYPRGFFRIINGGMDWVREVLSYWGSDDYSDWIMKNKEGYDCDYDLIGYGVFELLQTNSWIEQRNK
jgi:hypothetical protein